MISRRFFVGFYRIEWTAIRVCLVLSVAIRHMSVDVAVISDTAFADLASYWIATPYPNVVPFSH